MRAFTASVLRAVCAILTVALVAAAGACSGGESAHHNLLIIVSDALRADVLGCYGGAAQTPNIDRLAEGGILFERCYTTTPWTWPAAVSMFTGNYPGSYNGSVRQFFPERRPKPNPVTVVEVPEEEELFSEALESVGYELRMALQNQFPRQSNSLQGFVELDPVAVTAAQRASVESVVGPAVRNTPKLFSLLHYLLKAPSGRPFCLLTWVLDPHGEYDPPRGFRRRIDTSGEPLPREPGFYTKLNSWQLKKLTYDLDEREKVYIEALYRAEVEFVDRRVGYILNMLEHRGLHRNTIVVLTSDHGEAFWEHGFPSHGNTYFEEMVHVPLIISGPGITAGRRVETPVSHVGLAPTLAELLGVTLPGEVQGNSYIGLIQGRAPDPAPVYFMAAHQQLQKDAILDGGFKLIMGFDGSKALYRLETDPGEAADISGDHPDMVARLEARLLEIREENRRLRENREEVRRTGVPDVDDEEILEQMKALGYVE